MPGFRQGHLSGPKGLRDFIGPDPQTAIADKSDALWLVVQKYEQKELADDSEDEKRIKKAQEKACRRERQLASEDRSFFKAIEYLVHPTYASPVLTEVTGAHNAGVPSSSTYQFPTGKFSPTVSQISPIQDSVENDGADEDCFDEDQLIEVQLFHFIKGEAVFCGFSSHSVRGHLRTHIAFWERLEAFAGFYFVYHSRWL